MGSWGFRTFEDDIACDWLEDLFDSDPIAFFQQCLDLEGHDFLEFLACIGVTCTAEILHGLARTPRNGLPEAAYQWLDAHQELRVDALIPSAIDGLQRVLSSDSQMQLIWEDDGERFNQWRMHYLELIKGLRFSLIENT